MHDRRCLSVLELLDLAAGEDDPLARRHVACCRRCRALLAGLPDVWSFTDVPPARVRVAARPSARRPDGVRSGQLWRAVGLQSADWAEVVAVVRSCPNRGRAYLVVQWIIEQELATDADLVLGPDPLGYPAFLDLANPGIVLEEQLVTCLGRLPRKQGEALAALGRGLDPTAPTGVPVLAAGDPRLLAEQARADRLRALWPAADPWPLRADLGCGAIVPDEARLRDPGR